MRIPSLRKHKATGLAVVTIRGRDFYLGKWGRPEAVDKYQRLLREHYSSIDHRPLAGPDEMGDLTIVELTASYRVHIKKALSLGEQCNHKSALRSLEELFPDLRVTEFGPRLLIKVRDKFIERGLCRKTCNKYTRHLKNVFRWGVQEEIVRVEIWKALDAVQGLRKGASAAPDPEKVKPVPDHHFQATLPCLSRVVRGMAETQRGIGCRPGEATRIRLCEIDQNGIVARNGTRFWVWHPGQHKNQWRDQVAAYLIGPEVQSILTPFLHRDPESFCFSPREAEDEWNAERRAARTTPLYRFHIARQQYRRKKRQRRVLNTHYSTDSYRNCIKRACKAAGVPCWTPHQLRHLRATELAARYGIEQARRALAHSTVDTTAIYVERDLRELAEVLSREGMAS